MVLHTVNSNSDTMYEDCPPSGGSFTGLDDFNMNNCINTTTMIPGIVFYLFVDYFSCTSKNILPVIIPREIALVK